MAKLHMENKPPCMIKHLQKFYPSFSIRSQPAVVKDRTRRLDITEKQDDILGNRNGKGMIMFKGRSNK
jgi:hypothetical protein